MTGAHETATDLPEVLVEVIHRIRTDPGRLTRRFYEEALAGGLSDAEYVETVGVMATVIAIDSFCDAMGLPRHRLPAPVAGEPRRHRPAGAKEGLAWVPTVAPEDLTEAEAGMYDGLSAVNIHRALSLVPAEVTGFFDMDFGALPARRATQGLRHRIPGAHHARRPRPSSWRAGSRPSTTASIEPPAMRCCSVRERPNTPVTNTT